MSDFETKTESDIVFFVPYIKRFALAQESLLKPAREYM